MNVRVLIRAGFWLAGTVGIMAAGALPLWPVGPLYSAAWCLAVGVTSGLGWLLSWPHGLRARTSVTVRAFIGDAFRFLDEPGRAIALLPHADKMTAIERLPRGRNRMRFLARGLTGRMSEGEAETVEYAPPHRVVIRGKHESVTAVATRRLETVPQGTRVSIEVRYIVHRRILGRIMEFRLRRRVHGSLQRFLTTAKTEIEETAKRRAG